MSLYHACPKCGGLVERAPFEPVRRGRLCASCVRAALEPLFVRAALAARFADLAAREEIARHFRGEAR